MDKIRQRAETLLSRALDGATSEIAEMVTNHVAANYFGTSSTFNGAVKIYQTRLTAAITELLDQVSKRIEHRGRRWQIAFRSIEDAIDVAQGEADRAFAAVYNLGGIEHAARAQIKPKLIEVFDDLHKQVADFQAGWTAPRSKSWHERHPVIYAIFLLAVGAVIGAAITLVTDAIKQHPQPAAAPVPAAQQSPRPTSSQSPGPALADPSHDQAKPSPH